MCSRHSSTKRHSKEPLEDFPFEGISISYEVREAEDKDWNEQWEQEGFEPIEVRGKMDDGKRYHHSRWTASARHPSPSKSTRNSPSAPAPTRPPVWSAWDVFPVPRPDIKNYKGAVPILKMLDCGTGTGILAICALKLGAQKAVGYDIDEWSVDNARHNAVINGVDERFTSLLGDVNILKKVEGTFDLVTANINRNIDDTVEQKEDNDWACLVFKN